MSTQGMVESEPGSASFIIGSHPAKSKHLNQSSSGERAAYTSRNVEFRTSRAQSAISHSSERTLKGRSSHTPLLRVEQRAKSGRSKSAQSAQSRQSKGRPLSGKESVAATLVCPTPHSTASRPGTAVSTGEAKRRFSSAAPSRTGALSQSSIGHRQELSRVRVISQPIGLEPDVIAARDEVFEKGVFELVQKKIVPAAADFTKHLSRINALRAQSAPLHSFLERYPKYEFDTSPFPTAIRFDRIGAMHKIDNYANFGTLVPGDTPIPATPFPSKQSISSQQRSSRSPGAEEVDCEGGLVSSTVFAISNGSLVLSSPTFLWWRKISTLDDATKMAAVRRIELFCRRFRVPWVEVDYQKLEAFLSEPLISRFDVPAILALLANGLEIEQRIMKPGYLFFGVEAKRLAASRIAETWLATRQRKKHVYMVRKLRAAEVFRFYYRRKLQRRRLDKSAKKRFETILATYRSLQADFFATWTTKFHGLPRTIIHLPSLTVDAEARATAGFTVFEQMQLGRVMDLSDSDVNVVFISHPLDAALQGYTNEFLESHFAKPVEETLASCRLDFVVPENCNRFKPHSSLCAMLLASPIALQRIRDIAKDTSAFILPAVVSKREVELAVELNIPILGLDFAVEGIEGVLSTNPLSHSASLSEDIYTSVSVCIFPDGSFRLLGTSDTLLTLNSCRQILVAPQQSIDEHLLLERVISLSKDCANKGILGIASFDFTSNQKDFCCERITAAATPNLSILQSVLLSFPSIVSPTEFSLPPGRIAYDITASRRVKLHYMSSSPFTDLNHVKKSSGTQDVDDGPQWQERVSVVGTAFCHEALLGMKQEILGGMGCDAGIHFNEKWKHGTKFSSLGDCFEGSFYMMCLQQSLGQAVHTCLTNLQILHSRLHGDSPKLLSSNFPTISESLLTYLQKVKPSAFQEVLDPALSILEGLRKAPNPQKPLSLQTEEGDIASRGRNPLSPATLELLDTHIPSMRLPKLYPTTYTPLRSLPPDPEAALGTLGTPILPQRLSSPTRILPRTTTTAGYVEIMEARVDAALSAERAAALKVARARAAAERAAKEAAEAAEHAQWREERTRRATIERGMSLQERVERALEWRRGASVHARGGLAGHANEGNGEQDGNGGGKREKVKRSVREFLGKYSRDSVGRLRILAAGTTRKESSAGGRAKQLLDWGDQEEFEDDEFL